LSVPDVTRAPSVAILVDDLATWIVTGHQPTGIQRVVSELLDTAAARTDIDGWPAVSLGGGPDAEVRLVEVDRDSLRWEAPTAGLRLRRRYLQAIRRAVRRTPLPPPLRRSARLAYLRLAFAVGGIRASTKTGGRRADLLLVPGGFWSGDSAARIGRLAARGTKVRVIVYDLFPVRNPEWCDPHLCRDFAAALAVVVSVADRVVTLSDEVARQLIADHPMLAGKVRAAVPTLGAHAPRRSIGPDPRPLPTLVDPFVLAVGTVEPRKNYRVILDAWRIARQDPEMARASLVVVGRHGWMADDIEAEIARDATRLGIVRLAHTTDDELEALYNGCHATVHASWAEGFGLPVRESIARGIPTLMSSTIPWDGLPDDSYETFDPTDARRLAFLVADVLAAERVRAPATPRPGDATGWEPVLAALIDD
jgi:glycosyltransferase involved in cell wall biosynthesis